MMLSEWRSRLTGEVIVRGSRRGPRPALLLAYGTLSTVVALDPQAQWTCVVFGPPLVLIAWLDAIGKSQGFTATAGARKTVHCRRAWSSTLAARVS